MTARCICVWIGKYVIIEYIFQLFWSEHRTFFWNKSAIINYRSNDGRSFIKEWFIVNVPFFRMSIIIRKNYRSATSPNSENITTKIDFFNLSFISLSNTNHIMENHRSKIFSCLMLFFHELKISFLSQLTLKANIQLICFIRIRASTYHIIIFDQLYVWLSLSAKLYGCIFLYMDMLLHMKFWHYTRHIISSRLKKTQSFTNPRTVVSYMHSGCFTAKTHHHFT